MSCTYLAHHELESVIYIIIIIVVIIIIIIIIIVIVLLLLLAQLLLAQLLLAQLLTWRGQAHHSSGVAGALSVAPYSAAQAGSWVTHATQT